MRLRSLACEALLKACTRKPVVGELDLGGCVQVRAATAGFGRTTLRARVQLQIPLGFAHACERRAYATFLLNSCVAHWCRPPTTVIHAPQQRRHFESLIQVLGIDANRKAFVFEMLKSRGGRWRGERCHARGEAIQSGMQENSRLSTSR